MGLTVEQYRLVKDIMEHNSQMLGLSEESLRHNVKSFDDLPPKIQQAITYNRYKAIDCRVLHGALLDLKRQKMLAKTNDDGFIFLYNQGKSVPQSSAQSQVLAQAMGLADAGSPTKAGARRFEISDSKKTRARIGEAEAAKSLAGPQGNPANQIESL